MSKILYLHHWGVTRLSCLLSLCQEASRQWVSHRDEPPRTISGPYLLPSKSLNVVFKKIIERENTARVIAQQKKKKMKIIRSCLRRWRSVFSQLKVIHNFKCNLCLRQRIKHIWGFYETIPIQKHLRILRRCRGIIYRPGVRDDLNHDLKFRDF